MTHEALPIGVQIDYAEDRSKALIWCPRCGWNYECRDVELAGEVAIGHSYYTGCSGIPHSAPGQVEYRRLATNVLGAALVRLVEAARAA